MRTLTEIEAAAENLPPAEKQELILFLAARLRKAGIKLPSPRTFSSQEIGAWIEEDEADMRRFKSIP